jgi:hypothetical protein
MRSLTLICLIGLASGVFVGCGETPPQIPGDLNQQKIGPHQGVAYPLPDDLGYAEVVNEPEPETRGTTSTALVVYFLDPPAKASLATLPTNVTFQLALGNGKAQTVALKAVPKAEDPVGSGRFASDLGPYRLAELRGDLTATISGKPIKISLVGGR